MPGRFLAPTPAVNVMVLELLNTKDVLTDVGTSVRAPPDATGNNRGEKFGFRRVATLAASVALYSGIRSAIPVLAVPFDAAIDLAWAKE